MCVCELIYPDSRFSRTGDRSNTVDRIERAENDLFQPIEILNEPVWFFYRSGRNLMSDLFFHRSDGRCWANPFAFFNNADNDLGNFFSADHVDGAGMSKIFEPFKLMG